MLRRILTFPLTRLVIAVVVFLLIGTAVSFALALLTTTPAGLLTGEIVQALAALGALLFVGLVIERRSLAQIGFPRDRALPDLGRGLLLGAILLTLVVGIMALAGWYRVLGFAWQGLSENAAAVALAGLVLTAVIAIAEEVIFRGVFFRIVEEWVGSWIALALSALLFGLAHVSNPNSSLWAGIAIGLEAGVLFGAIYIFSRGLWFPIGLHWTWNYFEGWVYGTPVSGIAVPGLINSTTEGPIHCTGGAFGPEASVVAVVVCGGAGLYYLVRCHQERRIYTPSWLARLTHQLPSQPLSTG